MHALLNRLRKWQHTSPDMMIRLYKVLVRPVLSYGCQVWAVNYMNLPSDENDSIFAPSNCLEHIQRDFVRSILGVGKSVPYWCLLEECGLESLQVFWFKCALRFWNTMRHSPGSMLESVAKEDLLLVTAVKHKSCWTYHMCKVLARLGFLSSSYASAFLSNTPFPDDTYQYLWNLEFSDVGLAVEKMLRFWRDRVLNATMQIPRLSAHPKFATYVHWVGLRPLLEPAQHMTACMLRHKHVCLIRFRLACWYKLGMHNLRSQGISRFMRICEHCGIDTYDDELHVLLECPRHSALRAQYSQLFPDSRDASVKKWLAFEDQTLVADYLYLLYDSL
jgi:hypothetical protein